MTTWFASGIILAVAVPLFFLGLGDRHIWIPLEARYALVAREMLERGHWVLPHLGGEVYADKPPLLFWSIASLSSLTSEVSGWTARLPSAIAALFTCLLTWRIGARLFSPRAGLMAALVLATSAGYFWSGRQALPDMLLTLWITGASWALWEWLVAARRNAAVIAGLCMGLATLTKGPVGFLLPTLTLLAYLLTRREWRGARGREVTLCAGSFLAVTLAWYLPAVGEGGLAYARETLLHQSLQRYFRAPEHVAPFYFYLGAFPVEFLPWTLFLPQAMILGRGQRGGEDSRGWWFAFCWLVTPLAFFSLSSGKRDIYMLPAFPAAALLVGWAWSRWWLGVSGRRSFRGVIIPALLLVVSLWGLAGGVLAGSEWMLATRNRLLFPETLEARLWTAVLLGLGGALLASAAIMRRPRWVFGCTVGFFWLAMTAGVALIYNPQFNQRYPIKAFAQAIRSSIDPGKPLRACGNVNDLGLSFNLNRFLPAQTESDVTRYLTSDDPAWCVMNRRAYRRISEQTGRHFTVVVEQEFDRSTLLLVSNRP